MACAVDISARAALIRSFVSYLEAADQLPSSSDATEFGTVALEAR